MKEIEMFLLMNMDSPLARDRCVKLIEKNLNERVVGELEKLKGLGITYTDDVIEKRIKELKQ
jgi:hypothetical protein